MVTILCLVNSRMTIGHWLFIVVEKVAAEVRVSTICFR
jgi:hypothetical protein